VSATVRLPKPLLDAVDRRARAMSMSRSQWIARALERALACDLGWSPGFFERFEATDESMRRTLDGLLVSVSRRRMSKMPPKL
jgi:hypothetical protein